MLKVEALTHSGFLSIKHVVAAACGPNGSIVICNDHKPMTSCIGSGKISLLCIQDKIKIIKHFYHTEAVLSVEDNIINIICGKFTELSNDMSSNVQDKLYNAPWKKFILNREKRFSLNTWIDIDPHIFKTL